MIKMNELREYIKKNAPCPYNQVKEALSRNSSELKHQMMMLIDEGLINVFPAEGELHVFLVPNRGRQ